MTVKSPVFETGAIPIRPTLHQLESGSELLDDSDELMALSLVLSYAAGGSRTHT